MEWFLGLPPVTRLWLVASTGLSLTVYVSPHNWLYNLIWSWELFWFEGHWWRAATSLLFLGEVGPSLLVNLYFLYLNSAECEREFSWTSSVAYPGSLLVGGSLVLLGSTALEQVLPSLGFIMYVQGLRCLHNPWAQVNLFSFEMKAIYLPFACMAFHYTIEGSDITGDVIGVCAAGLVYALSMPLRSMDINFNKLTSLFASNPWRSHQQFSVGDDVTLCNIQSQPGWNGLTGNIKECLENGRYEVFVSELGRPVALKRACIRRR